MGDTLWGTVLVGAQDFIREGSPYMVRAGVLCPHGHLVQEYNPEPLPVLLLEPCLSAGLQPRHSLASAAPGLLALRTLSTLQ